MTDDEKKKIEALARNVEAYPGLFKVGATVGGGAISVVFLTILFFPLMAWRGFVGAKLWQWFIEPLWPQLGHLSVWAAVGVMFVVSLFMPHRSRNLRRRRT